MKATKCYFDIKFHVYISFLWWLL